MVSFEPKIDEENQVKGLGKLFLNLGKGLLPKYSL